MYLMKNVLKSSLYLFVFAIGGILFQIGCSNSNESLLPPTTSLNKIVYMKYTNSGSSIWTCNYDGTNNQEVPITFPANLHLSTLNGNAEVRLSPDGQKVFFSVNDNTDQYISNSIYSCNIDGMNLQEVVSSTSTESCTLGNVY